MRLGKHSWFEVQYSEPGHSGHWFVRHGQIATSEEAFEVKDFCQRRATETAFRVVEVTQERKLAKKRKAQR